MLMTKLVFTFYINLIPDTLINICVIAESYDEAENKIRTIYGDEIKSIGQTDWFVLIEDK